MFTAVRRISDRVASEAAAWLGTRERLAFEYLRTVKGKDLERYFADFPDPHVMLRRVLPDGVSRQLIEASQMGRRILCIFLIDSRGAIGDEYVITIDLDRGRVDRALSSPQLLLDPWLKKQYSTHYEYLSSSSYMRENKFLEALDAPFAPFGGRPFRDHYERSFLKRQEKITALFGHSRRFESLLFYLAPKLDSETCARFKSGMHKLWEYECWMRRRVTFAEAESALCAARLDVELVEVDRVDVMGDPETLLQRCTWTDKDQNVIARAEVCHDVFSNQRSNVGMYVFGEYFCHEDADRLLNCFHMRTETDSREGSKTTPQQAAQPS